MDGTEMKLYFTGLENYSTQVKMFAWTKNMLEIMLIPSSTNPYSWIATIKYINAMLIRVNNLTSDYECKSL